ncbi:MAG: MurR/RpiR family transcriptional regulator [Protaetiibacter sp.]
MSLRSVLAGNRKPLTNGDMQVVEVLLSNPQRTAFMPAAEIASRASVHESTVTRLAQKLGYTGFAQLREDLREDALAESGMSARLVQAANARRHELRALVQQDAEALLRIPAFVTEEELTRAANLILAAPRVYISGYPYGQPVSTYLERRLRRYGIVVVSLPDSPNETSELLQSMGADDLFIAIALRRPPSRLTNLLTIAESRGAKSLIITDVVGIQVRPNPTQIIAAPRGSDGIFRTPIVPMMLVYALQLTLLIVDPVRCSAALDRFDQVAGLLDAEGPANLYTDYFEQELLADAAERDS